MELKSDIFLNIAQCESVLEERLFHYLCQSHFFVEGLQIGNQYSMKTSIGTFRVDFIIKMNHKKIGIECDGKEFHIPTRDLYRDAIILEEKHLDSIYRIKAKDILYNDTDPLLLISYMENQIFTKRTQERFIKELEYFFFEKCEEWKQIYESIEERICVYRDYAEIHYPQSSDICRVDRYCLNSIHYSSNPIIKDFYLLSLQHEDKDLDRLIQIFHGYSDFTLVTMSDVNQALKTLKNLYLVTNGEPIVDEWFCRLCKLSLGQLNDGLIKIIQTHSSPYMPPLYKLLEACYSSKNKKNKDKIL